ncbi:MAG: 5'-nucleotidase C-terminal domain-containing protein [Pyrinomonadaceae bacterium]|nr:5'-nucleotidase C-terminal domain-containing protein [Pyrinomonadaceae bacterium]
MKHSIRHACCMALLGVLLLPAPGARAQAEQRGRSDGLIAPSPSTPPAARRATQSQVDGSIPDDPALTAIVAPYSAKVRELDTVIGQLEVELKKSGIGGGSLGNFVADAIRARAEKLLGKPVIFAATNSGGLRKNTIAPGPLRVRDIYELLPFENSLVAVDLTGEQLLRFVQVLLAKRDAQSGALLAYRTNAEGKNELHTVTLGQQQAILPNATYTIVTIDYLVKRGGDYAVLEEATNVRVLGQTIRDAVLDYVRAETAAARTINTTLDGRFHLQEAASASPENTRPQ